MSTKEYIHTSLFLAVAIVSIKSVKFIRKEKPYSVQSYCLQEEEEAKGRGRGKAGKGWREREGEGFFFIFFQCSITIYKLASPVLL